MKKITITTLLLFIVSFAVQAQKNYSLESLEKASAEELNTYLNKAIKLQKSGKTVNIVGCSILGATAVTIGGIAIADKGDWALGAAAIGFLGGLAGIGTLAVGIPMNITGKNRVKRVKKVQETVFNDADIDLQPCIYYNLLTQDYQPGAALRIRF